jgi:hypothetical protein
MAMRVIDMLKDYPEIELFGREKSYQLYQLIIEKEKDKSLLAYLIALGIPVSSALSLATKLVSDVCRIIDTLIQTIQKGEYGGGNVQTLLVDAVEYCRSILGILSGVFVALYSPSYAAKTFLTIPANPSNTFLTPKEGAYLYAMGDRLHAFLRKHEIDYRICSGTALGALREGGIILNDDDIDLMLHPSSVEKFTHLIQNRTLTRETGIAVETQAFTGGWQCFYPDSPRGQTNTPTALIGKPFVDIFPGVIRKLGNKEVITYGEDKMYLQSKGDHFTAEEWGKPTLYSFGPTKLLGIERGAMKNYLWRCYGPAALNYKTLLYPHETYSAVYGSPLRTYSILSKQPTPRYMRHVAPTPLDFDRRVYDAKIALANTQDTSTKGHLEQIEQCPEEFQTPLARAC